MNIPVTGIMFENQLKKYGIEHKLIRHYTPRHNVKVERSHCKDNEYFYTPSILVGITTDL